MPLAFVEDDRRVSAPILGIVLVVAGCGCGIRAAADIVSRACPPVLSDGTCFLDLGRIGGGRSVVSSGVAGGTVHFIWWAVQSQP